MNSLNQFGFISEEVATALGEDYKQSFSSESYSSYSTITNKNPSNAASSGSDYSVKDSQASFDRPPKQLKISGSPSSQLILSFENSNSSPTKPQQHVYGNFESTLRPKKEAASQIDHVSYFSSVVTKDHSVLKGDNIDSAPKTSIKGTKRSFSSMTRTPSHAQEHIMAERRRREKLSQRFIALSAILPGLKKVLFISIIIRTSIQYFSSPILIYIQILLWYFQSGWDVLNFDLISVILSQFFFVFYFKEDIISYL